MVEPNRRRIIIFMIFSSFKSGRNGGVESFVQSALRISPWALAWILKMAENKNKLTLSIIFRISLYCRKSVTLPKRVVVCHFQDSRKRSRRNPERWLDKTFHTPISPTFETGKYHENNYSSAIWLSHPPPSFCQAFRKTFFYFFCGFSMCVSTGTLKASWRAC